jgi:nucleoside-diphosphate-sugar epimerase
MARVLITGANSFIGTNFRKISENQNIEEISLKEIRPAEIDFSNFDVVLHLAAIVHQSRKIDAGKYFYVNRDLCIRVAELAKSAGVKQFIFLSSVKVYGRYIPGSDPWNEDSECNPDDPYGISKYQAELALKKLDNNEFTVSIIRTPIVYGPGVSGNILKIIKLIEHFPVLPFNKIKNNRHYTYVENLVGFIDRIIELRASGTFIAMDEFSLSTTYLVLYLSYKLDRKTLLFTIPEFVLKICIALMPDVFDRLYRSFYLDNSKTRKVLKYSPTFTSEEGLAMMISFYKSSKNKR